MAADKFSRIHNDDQIFRLTWIINNICTQHCDYCPSYLNSGKNHHYQWADAERFINRLCEQHKKIHVVISGGEPTVSPWFKDLVRMFHSRGHTVAVSSNAVRSGNYWDDCPVSIVSLSYHPQYHDDQFIQRVKDTQQRIPHVIVRVMMDPRYWDQCEIVYDRLKIETDVGLEAVRIVDWGAQCPRYNLVQDQWLSQVQHRPPKPQHVTVTFISNLYSEQGLQIYTDQYWPNKLINDQTNRFREWQCSIGQESLFVQFDGSVRRGNCEQGGYIGRLQEDFQLPTTPVICKQQWCRCDTDLLVSKSKNHS